MSIHVKSHRRGKSVIKSHRRGKSVIKVNKRTSMFRAQKLVLQAMKSGKQSADAMKGLGLAYTALQRTLDNKRRKGSRKSAYRS